MPADLTSPCTVGYGNPDMTSPYLESSDSWLAFVAGQRITGMSGVRRCRKSRGHSVKVETEGGNVVTVSASYTRRGGPTIKVERS